MEKTTRCKSILIVEDDDSIRETLKLVLQSEGYQVISATNGQDAIEIIHHGFHPNLILLDLMMPVMSGWEFLEARRTDEEIKQIPVIVMSAAKPQRPLAEVFMPKPLEIDHLLSQLKVLCA